MCLSQCTILGMMQAANSSTALQRRQLFDFATSSSVLQYCIYKLLASVSAHCVLSTSMTDLKSAIIQVSNTR
jgi:spore coat polysaccharide biosynthesis protein SpsF (cytidylyltransferase family)